MNTIERCTCYQELKVIPIGDGFSRFQTTEKDDACPAHGDVDEILASGRYTDRRGREWKERPSGVWSHAEQIVPVLGGLYSTRLPDQMRLLIERDQHRDECPGLRYCESHPVPHVATSWFEGVRDPFTVYEAGWPKVHLVSGSLLGAISAARALAANP